MAMHVITSNRNKVDESTFHSISDYLDLMLNEQIRAVEVSWDTDSVLPDAIWKVSDELFKIFGKDLKEKVKYVTVLLHRGKEFFVEYECGSFPMSLDIIFSYSLRIVQRHAYKYYDAKATVDQYLTVESLLDSMFEDEKIELRGDEPGVATFEVFDFLWKKATANHTIFTTDNQYETVFEHNGDSFEITAEFEMDKTYPHIKLEGYLDSKQVWYIPSKYEYVYDKLTITKK